MVIYLKNVSNTIFNLGNVKIFIKENLLRKKFHISLASKLKVPGSSPDIDNNNFVIFLCLFSE